MCQIVFYRQAMQSYCCGDYHCVCLMWLQKRDIQKQSDSVHSIHSACQNCNHTGQSSFWLLEHLRQCVYEHLLSFQTHRKLRNTWIDQMYERSSEGNGIYHCTHCATPYGGMKIGYKESTRKGRDSRTYQLRGHCIMCTHGDNNRLLLNIIHI